MVSLSVTLAAWRLSSSQLEEKSKDQFHREFDRVVELISERMLKYEDALWGGVGVVKTQTHGLTLDEWRAFAQTIQMEVKYPGINGIGVIYHVTPAEAPAFLAEQRRERPDFRIHPAHQQPELLPITFIEPEASNRAAVGLDMAHEANRYAAAKRARKEATAQITGPIVLVQDEGQTPGFLFYAPFYEGEPETPAAREAAFQGLVYAPFVVKKLVAGTLRRDTRHLTLSLRDGDTKIYDEREFDSAEVDPDPQFSGQTTLDMYGRVWTVEVWTDLTFRAETASAQPITILVAGLVIDALLLFLFFSLSRANLHAVEYADRANQALAEKVESLARSNQDLEQFAYAASHDLREPLRMVVSFNELIARRYSDKVDDEGRKFIDFAVGGARRMSGLLDGLLAYSRVATVDEDQAQVDCNAVLKAVQTDLSRQIEEAGATVDVGDLPTITGNEAQLRQVFQNLIGNAVKFAREGVPPVIRVSAEQLESRWRFAVEDNGIGIETEYLDKAFVIFQRLNARDEYPGMGVGLALVKRIVERHGGKVWATGQPGEGSTFYVELPV